MTTFKTGIDGFISRPQLTTPATTDLPSEEMKII